MGVSLSELQELVMDREAWRAVIHGVQRAGPNLATDQEAITDYHIMQRLLSHFSRVRLCATP